MKDILGRFLVEVFTCPGLTDREITDRIVGKGARVQPVNRAAHALEKMGKLERRCLVCGKIGNFPVGREAVGDSGEETCPVGAVTARSVSNMSEEDVKSRLKGWLEAEGWEVRVKWGHGLGVDIEATRGDERWLIEAKGSGSKNPIKQIHFLTALGEALQAMNDPVARYAIAFPDSPKFRRLWAKLPTIAKSRTGVEALFVTAESKVDRVA